MGRLASVTARADTAAGKALEDRFRVMEDSYQAKQLEMQGAGRRTTRQSF